ncbi:EAL domain-containing protein [Clostridium sp. Sa3CVN1]|uniref:EAL domain-containing protein n=2 Tax=Clostridium cibarium TaxID=2762247 RepID=A0ABR8PX58_9CLOT|nr:EAL domain-containing protein [Clostridium cibarium]
MIKGKIQEKFSLEFKMVDQKGKIINIECSGKGKIRDNCYVMTGIIIDITEKTNQNELLRISEKNYRRALEGSQEIMFYIYLRNNCITLNGKISKLLDFQQKNEYNFTMEEWITYIVEEDRDKYKRAYFDFVSNKKMYFNIEYRVKNFSDKYVWLKVRGKRILEEDGEYIYGSMNDDTDRKEKELKIYYMSNYDEVTDIPNRRYFVQRSTEILRESIKDRKKFAIIFIDIDNFKFVNDTYGHAIGDEVLKKFCKKLKYVLEENCLLARFGGDEFVVAVHHMENNKQIIGILDKILEEFNLPLDINGKEIYNTVSMGVSIAKVKEDNIQTLLKKADIAIYTSKTGGKNRCCLFNEALSKRLDRELSLNRCIRKAVKNEEVYFLFQPKYWTKNNKIQGFECLARWKSEVLGIVFPMEFIPLAETSGFIIHIGKYLMEDAFKKCNKLIELFSNNIKIAINLSQVQIRDEGLVYFIEYMIKKYGISPNNIEFEVTESIIMKSVDKNIQVLEKLKSLGVSIALDDFGTGYSSLNYLKILPIDTVKIDKSFIKDIGKDFKDEFIIEKIIELAHLLDLEVVAEGVETEQQLKYLIGINCDIIQGYYFSKPLEFEKVINLDKEK